jgi:hypothetical protein
MAETLFKKLNEQQAKEASENNRQFAMQYSAGSAENMDVIRLLQLPFLAMSLGGFGENPHQGHTTFRVVSNNPEFSNAILLRHNGSAHRSDTEVVDEEADENEDVEENENNDGHNTTSDTHAPDES